MASAIEMVAGRREKTGSSEKIEKSGFRAEKSRSEECEAKR